MPFSPRFALLARLIRRAAAMRCLLFHAAFDASAPRRHACRATLYFAMPMLSPLSRRCRRCDFAAAACRAYDASLRFVDAADDCLRRFFDFDADRLARCFAAMLCAMLRFDGAARSEASQLPPCA